jgi:hypothetical protein
MLLHLHRSDLKYGKRILPSHATSIVTVEHLLAGMTQFKAELSNVPPIGSKGSTGKNMSKHVLMPRDKT